MKSIIICLAIYLAGVFALDSNSAIVSTGVEKSCLIEHGIDPELLEKDKEGKLTIDQVYCIGACVYKSEGVMKPDGTIDLQKVEELYGKDDDTEGKAEFFEVYYKCQENTDCKLVKCMIQEVMSNLGENSNDLERGFFSGRVFRELLNKI